MIKVSTSLFTVGNLLVLAASSPPVALIENVKGSPAGIQVMDYVESGQVIRLGSGDSIVLSYLKSCWRETITGGTVIVGTEKSEVMNGKVERSLVACQGSKMQPAPALTNNSGAMIFRGEPRLRPQVTLYGLSPVIEVDSDGSLVIKRIDRPEERREISFSREQLMHNKFLDLAKSGVVLTAGGIYRAVTGNNDVIFNIDPEARAVAPIVSRLLRFQPAN